MSQSAGVRSEKSLASVLERLLRVGFLLGGFLSVAVGVWMLADPAGWYELVPGPASDYGPVNAHFIRDVGGWYVAQGILFLFASTNPRRFGGVTLIVTLVANGAHAVGHLADIASARVGAEHWATDMPLVAAPVVFLVVMLWIWWSLQSGGRPGPRRIEVREEDTEGPPDE